MLLVITHEPERISCRSRVARNAETQYFLGRTHHEGRGLPEDNRIAFEWARKSAEQGNGDAEALLGVLYAQGQEFQRTTW